MLADTSIARNQRIKLIEDFGGFDFMFISISAWCDVYFSKYEAYEQLINVDAKGFFAMADVAMEFFIQQRSGHLVGISSSDALRGSAVNPVYCGAKAFVSKYLEGMRNKMIQNKVPIYVTDIIPGYVNNERLNFSEMGGTYWV